MLETVKLFRMTSDEAPLRRGGGMQYALQALPRRRLLWPALALGGLLLLSVLSVSLALADNPDTTRAPKPDTAQAVHPDTATGILAGLVTDVDRHSPVRAFVEIQGTNLKRNTTSYGYFDFYNIPPGRYSVLVSTVEFATDTLKDVLIQPKLTTVVSSRLKRTLGTLWGLVTDAETGEGVPGVVIRVQGTNSGGVTDVKGSYWIVKIPPGKYTVKATTLGYSVDTNKNVKIQPGLRTESNFKIKPKEWWGHTE